MMDAQFTFVFVALPDVNFVYLLVLIRLLVLCPFYLQVYASTSRDNLLAAVRDVLQTEVSGHALLGH